MKKNTIVSACIWAIMLVWVVFMVLVTLQATSSRSACLASGVNPVFCGQDR